MATFACRGILAFTLLFFAHTSSAGLITHTASGYCEKGATSRTVEHDCQALLPAFNHALGKLTDVIFEYSVDTLRFYYASSRNDAVLFSIANVIGRHEFIQGLVLAVDDPLFVFDSTATDADFNEPDRYSNCRDIGDAIIIGKTFCETHEEHPTSHTGSVSYNTVGFEHFFDGGFPVSLKTLTETKILHCHRDAICDANTYFVSQYAYHLSYQFTPFSDNPIDDSPVPISSVTEPQSVFLYALGWLAIGALSKRRK